MTDLIKRDDALAAIDTFKRDFEQSWKVQFSADIAALPAVPTHRYAGESEASVYDRKGFPPIGLQGHAHAPVADRQPAATREDALQARVEELVNSLAWYQMMDAMSSDHVVELTDKLEAAEAKRAKITAAFRINMMRLHEGYTHEAFDADLAELEGK